MGCRRHTPLPVAERSPLASGPRATVRERPRLRALVLRRRLRALTLEASVAPDRVVCGEVLGYGERAPNRRAHRRGTGHDVTVARDEHVELHRLEAAEALDVVIEIAA